MITLIRKSTIVNADKTFTADILIADNKIVYIADNIKLDTADYHEIDATGLYAFPGGIDPHVHMALPSPAGNSTDDFYSGSVAALAGGTTTMLDFVTPHRGQSLIDAFNERKREANKSLIDYRFHMGISEYTDKTEQDIEKCIQQEGISSFKAYLAYKNTIGINIDSLERLMKQLFRHNALLMIHCEDGDEIDSLQKAFISKHHTSPYYHMFSRPEYTESSAVEKVLKLVESTGCRTYLVHISAKESVEKIVQFKKNSKVFAETCPQYLLLNNSNYKKGRGGSLKYMISPPLRGEESVKALWSSICNGTIEVISTDHCPFNTIGQKDIGISDFTKIPSGAGGVEYRLPLLYTYGVLENRIILETFVGLISTNAAKIFGLYPQKGIIAIGSDADIVLWNPNYTSNISLRTQFQKCDANIYDGITVHGRPEYVICGGKVAFKSGILHVAGLHGKLL